MRQIVEMLRSKVREKAKLDNKGITLVELLCTIAILTIISATIGGVLMVSARTYQRGTTETALQQEAQFTANRISGLIVDATQDVRYYYVDASGYVEVEKETDVPAGVSADRMLEIANGTTTNIYQILYNSSLSELTYVEIDSSGVASAPQLLAENVTAFAADVSTFDSNRNVVLSLGFTVGTKTYHVDYNMTSRNGATTAVAAAAIRWAYVNIDPADIIIEPGETYIMDVDVQGSTAGFNCTLAGNSAGDTTAVVNDATKQIVIKAGLSETGDTNGNIYLTINTNEKKDDGVTPLATRVATFHVRRTKNVTLTKTLKSGTDLMLDAEYEIKADVDGTYMDRKLGAAYDNNYKNPYYIKWEYEYTINGTTAVVSDYFDITDSVEDARKPYVKLKLKQDMAGHSILTIKATAKHPEGTLDGTQTNKSGSKYGTVIATITIEQPDDPVTPVTPPIYTELSDIKRGQDYMFSDASAVTSLASGVSATSWNWFYRICRDTNNNGTIDAGENWTMFYKTNEGGSAKKYNASETAVLLPDYGYFLEYIYVGYDSSSQKICWPYDESLLQAGKGFYECAGHYTKGWDDSVTAMTADDYTTRYYVPKVTANFKKNDSLGIVDGALRAGTKDDPLQYTGSELVIDFNEIAIEKAHFNYDIKVQKWDGSSWQDSTLSYGVVQCSNDCYRIHNATSDPTSSQYAHGLYRIGMTLQYNRVTTLSGANAFSPTYTSEPSMIYPLYDWSADTGVIYINFN